jgi:hypothetical protein
MSLRSKILQSCEFDSRKEAIAIAAAATRE